VMDSLERRIIQLKIEQVALKKETDPASKKQLEKLAADLKKLEDEYKALEVIWKSEKNVLHGAQSIKSELEKVRVELENARRKGDLSRMAELQYGRIPELEKQLTSASTVEEKEQASKPLFRNKVTDEEIAEVVSKWTHIPVSKMLESEKERLLHMEDALHQSIVGQSQAVTAVSNAIRRSRAGLSNLNRPIGSFLFLGPTGVGKTELCKTLAEFLFDTSDAMIRIDMSEYMEKHAVSRLLGAPPGYVGYEEGGYLTEQVRRKPYSVILLDEMEKAHPDVFNILLQILDDGRLTDSQGRTVDFKNTIVAMTSNLGSELIHGIAKQGDYFAMREAVMGVVGKHFRPEFINRIDEIVVFHPLDQAQIKKIASIELNHLRERLKERGLNLDVQEEVMDYLTVTGYDPVYGARPLKRAIQQYVENPLAQEILGGHYLPGETIKVGMKDEHIVFT
ncbi:MAG: hypothetical protein ACD_60C00049G0001, partial [uncultured bacterium]